MLRWSAQLTGGVVGSIPKMWFVSTLVLLVLVFLGLVRFLSLRILGLKTKGEITMENKANKNMFWSAGVETIWALMTNIAAGCSLTL